MSLTSAAAVSTEGDGTYTAEIHAGWDIMGNANGGYMMSIAARAAADAVGRPDPVSVTAHFMRPGVPGPVTVSTDVLREGRRFAVVGAAMASDDLLLTSLGTYGTLDHPPDVMHTENGPPDLAPIEDCIQIEPTETFPPPFMGRVDVRIDPRDNRFFSGSSSGRPRIQGWLRLRDDEPIDTMALLVAVDAFPPAIFNTELPVAWTPTVELTAHVRARPAPGWLRCVFSTRFITDGFLEEDGEIWDETGRLVAQSRQLALVPKG